jgi:WD40 repeat protein
MKTILLSLTVLLSCSAFAQQRCEDIFANEKSLVEQLAQLHVQIENMDPSGVRQALSREHKKKLTLAKKTGVDLSSLNSLIEEYRDNAKTQTTEDEQRIQEIRQNENGLIDVPFVIRNTIKNDGPVFRVHRFIQKGQKLFESGFNRSAIYDASTHNLERDFSYEAKISDDGQLLVNVGDHGDLKRVKVVDLKAKREDEYMLILEKRLSGYEISPDKRWLAIITSDRRRTLTLFDLQNPQQTPKMIEILSAVTEMSFSGDGQRLLILDSQRKAVIYDTNTLTLVQEVQFNRPPQGIHLTQDGNHIIVPLDSRIGLYDLKSKSYQELHEVKPLSPIRGGRYILVSENSSERLKKIYILDLKTNRLNLKTSALFNFNSRYDVAEDGSSFLIDDGKGKIDIWAAPDQE